MIAKTNYEFGGMPMALCLMVFWVLGFGLIVEWRVIYTMKWKLGNIISGILKVTRGFWPPQPCKRIVLPMYDSCRGPCDRSCEY